MCTAIIKMTRRLFSREEVEFSCDFDKKYTGFFRSDIALYYEDEPIFKSEPGIDKFIYKKFNKPVIIEYESGDSFSMHLTNEVKLFVVHVKSGFCKNEYEIKCNEIVLGHLKFSSKFFPYREEYKLTSFGNDDYDFILFALFAWYSHESTCTF